ncbi:unnamed protein product [Acanthoscelides obtectus]|uniref:Uncharacterized protein n=1 Tax=Acanthoscelides obtectus TaxID=200917 RepID=A0A9P0MDP4_ACAOB|nr:unnamed protein product [Acanthoscelides obtectus]CAK1680415.1 hypothetical protein AOBTE_LOCUS32636 [Acanthoscelides obtectus]
MVLPFSSANNNSTNNSNFKGQNRSTPIDKEIHVGKTVSSKQESKTLTSENIQFLQLLGFKSIFKHDPSIHNITIMCGRTTIIITQ